MSWNIWIYTSIWKAYNYKHKIFDLVKTYKDIYRLIFLCNIVHQSLIYKPFGNQTLENNAEMRIARLLRDSWFWNPKVCCTEGQKNGNCWCPEHLRFHKFQLGRRGHQWIGLGVYMFTLISEDTTYWKKSIFTRCWTCQLSNPAIDNQWKLFSPKFTDVHPFLLQYLPFTLRDSLPHWQLCSKSNTYFYFHKPMKKVC